MILKYISFRICLYHFMYIFRRFSEVTSLIKSSRAWVQLNVAHSDFLLNLIPTADLLETLELKIISGTKISDEDFLAHF